MSYTSEATLVKGEIRCELCNCKSINYISIDVESNDTHLEFCLCGRCSVLFQWLESEYLEMLVDSDFDIEGVLSTLSTEGIVPPVRYPFFSFTKPLYRNEDND